MIRVFLCDSVRTEDKSKLGKPIKIKVKPETPVGSDQKDGPQLCAGLKSYEVAAIKHRRQASRNLP